VSVKVITPPAAEPITLDEAKAHLRVFGPDDDAQIEGMISAARGMLEKKTGRLLMPQVVEFATPAWGYGIRAQAAPFRELVGVTYIDPEGVTVNMDPASVYVDSYIEPALIGLPYGGTWPAAQIGSLRIVRAAVGYDDADSIPAPLKQWMLTAIAAMYDHRSAVIAGTIVATLPEDFMHWLWHPYRVYF
jgi:uncharacterized phiE125 gp8 family phage protein